MAKKDFPRKGAWAKLADGTIGIINSIQGNSAEFHTVDAKGETVAVTGAYKDGELISGVPLEFLQQAQLSDIPKPRRPAMEKAVLLGYAKEKTPPKG